MARRWLTPVVAGRRPPCGRRRRAAACGSARRGRPRPPGPAPRPPRPCPAGRPGRTHGHAQPAARVAQVGGPAPSKLGAAAARCSRPAAASTSSVVPTPTWAATEAVGRRRACRRPRRAGGDEDERGARRPARASGQGVAQPAEGRPPGRPRPARPDRRRRRRCRGRSPRRPPPAAARSARRRGGPGPATTAPTARWVAGVRLADDGAVRRRRLLAGWRRGREPERDEDREEVWRVVTMATTLPAAPSATTASPTGVGPARGCHPSTETRPPCTGASATVAGRDNDARTRSSPEPARDRRRHRPGAGGRRVGRGGRAPAGSTGSRRWRPRSGDGPPAGRHRRPLGRRLRRRRARVPAAGQQRGRGAGPGPGGRGRRRPVARHVRDQRAGRRPHDRGLLPAWRPAATGRSSPSARSPGTSPTRAAGYNAAKFAVRAVMSVLPPGAAGAARAGVRDRSRHGRDRVQPGAVRRRRRAGGQGLRGRDPAARPRTWPSASAGSPPVPATSTSTR